MTTEIEHDLIVVDEFDALRIEVRVPAGADLSLTTPSDKYPAKLHAKKVIAELDVDDGLIFLPGEPTTLFEDSDMGPAFRQRRYFYYLSGANFADCAVTYEIARGRLILWIPYVEPKQVLWYGSTPGIAECLSLYDVDEVRYVSQLDKFLSSHLVPGSTLYVIHRNQVPPVLPLDAGVRVDASKLMPAMDEARVVKTDYEVGQIRRANDISSRAHRKVAQLITTLENEREIEALFVGECTANGAHTQAYPVIAGSGVNAATLHYSENDLPLRPNQLVVVDAGCEWRCYASDVTRTLPIRGTFSPEAREIYAAVERMQDECVARIKPGVVFYSLHLHACSVALAELLKLGVLVGSPAEIWTAGTVAAFFPHGLGHHVGLETHDVTGNDRLLLLDWREARAAAAAPGRGRGRQRAKRAAVTAEMLAAMVRGDHAAGVPPPYRGRQALRKNMIVTVEPGIYFCREYIEGYFLSSEVHSRFINKARLERYYAVGGVRIEDDILVTLDGHENLTTAPKGEEMLRIVNAGREMTPTSSRRP